MANVLYYGDNLDILPRYVRYESVDLIYLDPPFNSNANYNVLFPEHGNGTKSVVQLQRVNREIARLDKHEATQLMLSEIRPDVRKPILKRETLESLRGVLEDALKERQAMWERRN